MIDNLFDEREHVLIHKTWIYPKNARIKDEHIKIYDDFFNSAKQHNKKEIVKLFNKYFKGLETPITKKRLYNYLSMLMQDDKVSGQQYSDILFLLVNIGFMLHTVFPASFNANDMVVPNEFKEKRNELIQKFKNKELSEIEVEAKLKELGKELYEWVESNNPSLLSIAKSGTKGGAGDFMEFFLSTGLHLDNNGKLLNVGGAGFVEGQSMTDYATLTPKGYIAQYSKSYSTAEGGEIIASLNKLTADIKLSKLDDCGSKKYINIYIKDKATLNSFRYKLMDNGKLVNPKDETLIGKQIKVRSAFYCNAKDGVCRTCLNKKEIDFMKLKAGANLGNITVSSIATPITELALKKAHASSGLNLNPTNISGDSGVNVPYLEITEHKVVAKKQCRVILNKDLFKNMEETAESYTVPIVEIFSGEEKAIIDVGYDLNVMKNRMETKGKIIELYYREGETIVDTPYKDVSTNTQKIKAIVNHRLKYYNTPEQILIALNEIWQTLVSISIWRVEIMLLNTYVEYLEDKHMYIRTQLGSQDYSDKTKVNIVQSVKRLNHALVDNVGYMKSGVKETLGLNYRKNSSDIEKVMFANYDEK